MIRYKTLFVGSLCNNDCITCSNTGEKSGQPLDVILSEMGAPEGAIDSIALVGGEPAIRQDMATVVSHAKERGWRRIKMLTNARAFSNPEVAVGAMQAGVRVFEVKLCGHAPQLHDALTQTRGSFMETVTGLSNLKNTQKPAEIKTFVGVRIPVAAVNHPYLPQIVAFAMQFRADRITLAFADPGLRMSDAIPSAKAAIETALVNSTWAQTEGAPLCLMDGYEQHVGEAFGPVDLARQRREPCASCAYVTCEGIPVSYLDAQGADEFVPVLDSVYAERMKESQ